MGQKDDYLDRFFRDGKTVILPIDHGTAIPVPGLERPDELIRATRDQVDGYVVNFGLARAFEGELEGKGLCFRTDVYKPAAAGNTDEGAYRVFAVEEALQVGAAAVMNMLYLHHPNESVIIRECADLIADCATADLPVILEALPYGIGRPEDYTLENIGFTVRLAAELGADVVKTAYPTGASADEFKAIVDACFVPVIVLGGAAMGDDRALLTMVSQAMAAGVSGVAVGRNVWQHANPSAIAGALHRIVHEGAPVDDALEEMRS
jgi:DhnA family fructose-bisphosphate aldolase class Ia